MKQARIELVSEINTCCYYGWATPTMQRASYICDAIMRYNLSGNRLTKYIKAVDNFIAKTEAKF